MNRTVVGNFLGTVSILAMFVSSCRQQQQIPLPVGESAYAQPIARPLQYSAPENINWEPPYTENLQPPDVRKIDFSKIPSRVINTGSFQPLPQPLPGKKFNWDHLAETSLDWKGIPENPLETELFVLPEPEAIPVTPPKIRPDELTGIAYLGLNEGLPAAKMDDITQDDYGIIWFINEGKLFRYDGTVVQKYTLQGNPVLIRVMRDKQGLIWVGADNQNGLFVLDVKSRIQWHVKLPSSIFVVHQDVSGLYWAGTLGKGVFILDWQKKTSRQLLLANEDKTYNTANTVLDFYEDKKGQVWMASAMGIKILTASKNKILTISTKEGLHTNNIWEITPDSRGRLWLGSRDYPGITILYPDEARIQYAGPVIGFSKFIINALEAPDHYIYLPTDSLIYVLDPSLHSMKTIETTSNYKSRIWYAHSIIDKSGQLWAGSINNGLQLIDTRGIMPVHLDKSKGLGGNAIYGLMEDHRNQLWMGIGWNYPEKTGKVNKLDIPANRIYDFTPVLDTPIVNMYTSMEDHKNRIWLGLYGKGIYVLDFSANTVTTMSQAQGILPWGSAIFEDSRKQVWLGQANGIVLMDSSLQIIRQFNEFIQGKESTIVSIREDKNQQVWIATTGNGIYRIDSARMVIQHFGVDEGLAGPEVNGLTIDNEGRPWIATNKGVTVIDDQQQQLYNLSVGNGLINAVAFSILNVKGEMAVGTAKGLTTFTEIKPSAGADKGLFLSARSYDRNQGLAYLDFNAGSGTSLQDGRMAFGIDFKVLSIFGPPATDTVSSPVYLTGITLEGKPLILSDNQSLAAQLNDKDSLRDEASGAVYTISKLPADTEYFSRENITWAGLAGAYNLPVDLKLKYHQNYLQFLFTGMHYRDRDKIRYRYILEGVDRKWSEFTDKQITEPYRDLPPGKYVFKVAAINTSGRWSQSDPYTFTILPPWWKTGWAYTLYALMVIAAISSLVRIRSRQLKKMNLLLEERIRLRTSELQESIAELKNTQSQLIQAEKMASLGELTAGIAHEIKNPLNFVSNFAEINKELLQEMTIEIDKGNFDEVKALAHDVIENAQKIMYHGKRADDIVKGMLQHSRTSTGVKEPTDINNLADEYLRLAYHGLRAKEKSFNATLKTDFDERIGTINVIPQDIGRVILNLITNAFYAVAEKKIEQPSGYEPTVTVSTRKIGSWVEIRVRDNGNGIPQKVMDKIFQPFFTTKPTGQGTGLGLSLSYDIVKAHGGDLKVKTEEGQGATFIILLPLT
ncbi:sensor histidine kinase [Flavihumibacter fluvii]|uniref:sensor histidine kinase n=1 Tax=Flavihumibacter fluvii TaxID=2838157 RepID=UPI001BDF264F|nr:ATP-binding protein [Flavihumibacter fluvii]ULQ52762.1 ATP-binding protein [Flavihumibacter fluvii]